MKYRLFSSVWAPLFSAVTLLELTPGLAAQDAPASAPAANVAAPLQLSGNTMDVLKLVRGKIGDDTVVAFIKNSGTSYSLSAAEMIYLRSEGVSDRLLSTMLAQTGSAPNRAASTSTTTVVSAQPATTTTYVQSAPATTVYVEPPVYYGYYGNYPYYPYYSYPYPAISLSWGFRGGGYHGGGFHGGGFHGGGFHGGGFHGGGGSRGGHR